MAFDSSKVDLSSLSQASDDDEFDGDVNELKQGDDNLNFTMGEAVKINPDQHAKVLNLSQESGAPPFAVQSDIESAEQDVKSSQFNFSNLRDTNPSTAKFLTDDFNNSVVAQDDVDVLQKLEDIIKPVTSIIPRGAAGATTGTLGLSESIFRTPDAIRRWTRGISESVEDVTGLPRALNPVRAIESTADFFASGLIPGTDIRIGGGSDVAGEIDIASQILTEEFEPFKANVKAAQRADEAFKLALGGDLSGVAEVATDPAALAGFIGQAAPSLVTSYMSGGSVPFMAWMESMEVASDAADFEARTGTNISDVDFMQAQAQVGIINSVLEKFVPDVLLKGEAGKSFRSVLATGVQEFATEATQAFNTNLAERLSFDPDKDLTEGILAGALGGFGTGVAAGGAQFTANKFMQQEKIVEGKSQVDQVKIDQINESSENSKLRERDKESFKQFIIEADGNADTQVYIDGEQVALYLKDKTPEEIQSDPVLQLLAAQANEASVLGSDVQVPIADFAAEMAGTEHYEALRDSMTMSTDTVSPAREDQVKQEGETFIRNLMEEAQETASEFVEAQEIYDSVREQLIDTGTVNAANADYMAQVVPAWATAQARRQGKTVQQVYQESGLVIEGPLTGERARIEIEEGVVFKQKGKVITEEDITTFIDKQREKHKATEAEAKTRLEAEKPAQADQLLGEMREEHKASETEAKQRLERAIEEQSATLRQEAPKDVDPVERRIALKRERREAKGSKARALFDKLSREELINELLKHELTGIKGRKAFVVDVEDAQAIASIDADSLKWINDNLSPDHGDALLQAVADALESETEGAYHISGDEFYVLGETQEEIQNIVDNTIEKLSSAVITATKPDGTIITLNGLNITVGIGENKDAADQKLKKEKVRREETGERASRGEQPLGSIIRSPEGFDPDGEVSEEVTFKQPGDRGFYEPANSIIRLTESSDLSTFLHEFAHFMYEMEVNGDTELLQSINGWYKRNAEDVAKEAGGDVTPDDVIKFLDENTIDDKDKDTAIRRAVHEQFARGFEAYVKEGKAPSIELRNAFRAFARWLSRIYQAVRGQLNVNLDDEVRKVFDRLLATEEQIAAAEARAQVEPMFTDAAMAGMTDKEFADYQTRQEKVKDVHSETLRDKIVKQLTRQTKAWWKEEKQDLIDEEIDRLKNERVYLARERLKAPIDTTITDEKANVKLDHAAVKEMVGIESVNKLGRKSTVIPPELNRMTAKGMQGVHPDEAAMFFGYSSGSQMIDDLVNAPKIKDAADEAAEIRMKEIHGDIFTDGTLEREADEAIQSEERGALILHELKIIARGTTAPTIDRAAIKAAAEDRIGKLAFREIHPGKYRRAEIRAAQESATMLAEGNRQGAAEAKLRQAMNYYLGMAATNAKNDTMKIVDRMSRYNKKKVREDIQKAANGYWEQITKILSRFEFRKAATLKGVENINTWAKERNETDGDGLVLSPATLNESYVTHWKNVPFSELQGINDSVKNIEHVARYANKIKLADEEIEFKKLKNQWIESIELQDQRFATKESRSRIEDSRKASTEENVRKWASQLTKMPFLASWLDGGERTGISHDILTQQFTDALDAKLKLTDEVAIPVMELIDNRSKEDQRRHMAKLWIPEINDHLTGDQVLAVALNTGNQGNLKKLLLGEGWADPGNEAEINFNNPRLQAILNHMSKSDWEMVQKIWDQMELLYPQLAEVHRRTTGLVPPKIQSTPVVTEHGTFKGGYYPVKYSPRRSHKAEKNAEKRQAETDSMFNNTASIQASVNAGATNERTGFYDRIYLSLEVVPDHFNETIHYITHHDPVRQANRLIQSPDVASAITGVLGEEEFKQIKPWLNDIAKDGRQQPTKTYVDVAFQRLRFGVTLGVMGFKASTGIMQLFGLLTTAAEVGVGPAIKGVQTAIGHSWYMNAVRGLLGSRDDMQTGWDFAAERSKVMPHRMRTMDREIKNAMERLRGKAGITAAIQEASMKHIALIQTYMVDLPTWHAAYDKEISESGNETKAIQRADWSVENLQGSGATKNMAAILRNQGKIHTTFTMFMTYFSSLGNLSRDLVKGGRTGLYSPTSVVAKTMFLFTIPVFLEMLMRGDLDDPEDEDERMNKYLTNVALYPLASVPFVRDVAAGVIGDFGYNTSPVASVIEKGTAGIKQISERVLTDEEITKSATKGATKLTAAALAIPGINQIWATGEHLYDVIEEGEELTARELIFGPKRD